jgi:hypothetical protein
MLDLTTGLPATSTRISVVLVTFCHQAGLPEQQAYSQIGNYSSFQIRFYSSFNSKFSFHLIKVPEMAIEKSQRKKDIPSEKWENVNGYSIYL